MHHLIKHHLRAAVGTVKFAYKVVTHPATARAAHIVVTPFRFAHKVVTHPATAHTAHIAYKAWLHGARAAKHTTAFMVKVASKGFKLRG